MAVYTLLEESALARFLAPYHLGSFFSCTGIAEGVENSNFLLEMERGRYILTLFERRVKTSDLPFFLSLMLYLSQKGIPCPLPLQTDQGCMYAPLCGKPATLVTFLPGLSAPSTLDHCQKAGEALALLHLAGQDFPHHRPNPLSLQGWQTLWAECRPFADHLQKGLSIQIEADLSLLSTLWPQKLPSGIIHGDLFPDNIFFLEEKVSGIIDFYFACWDFFAYDIAICLNAWCFEEGRFDPQRSEAILVGYQKIRPLQPEEWQALPLLIYGAALRFFLTRLQDWFQTPEGAMVQPKDPMDYAQRLTFHRQAHTLEAYGLRGTLVLS